MAAVDPVEFAPLIGRERPQERVIHNLCLNAKLALAGRQARVHLLNLRKDRGTHVLGRHAPRDRALRSFPATGQMAKIQRDQRANAMFQGCRCGPRSALFHASGDPFVCGRVSEIEMLKDLGGIPLPFRSLRHGSFGQISHYILEFPAQAFEMGIHSRVQYNDRDGSQHHIRGFVTD